MTRNLWTAAGAALALLVAGTALAGPTPAQKCESGKNKEAGKYGYCRQKAESKFALTGDGTARTAALTKCGAKYGLKWPGLETKAVAAGGTCPSTGDQAAIQGFPRHRHHERGHGAGWRDTARLRGRPARLSGRPRHLQWRPRHLHFGPDELHRGLSTCNGSLGTTQASLTTCTGDLGTCNGTVSTNTGEPDDVQRQLHDLLGEPEHLHRGSGHLQWRPDHLRGEPDEHAGRAGDVHRQSHHLSGQPGRLLSRPAGAAA